MSAVLVFSWSPTGYQDQMSRPKTLFFRDGCKPTSKMQTQSSENHLSSQNLASPQRCQGIPQAKGTSSLALSTTSSMPQPGEGVHVLVGFSGSSWSRGWITWAMATKLYLLKALPQHASSLSSHKSYQPSIDKKFWFQGCRLEGTVSIYLITKTKLDMGLLRDESSRVRPWGSLLFRFRIYEKKNILNKKPSMQGSLLVDSRNS